MKITIESTETTLHLDGVPVRIWNGRTEDGVECLVFVHRVGFDASHVSPEAARALVEQHAPKLVYAEIDVGAIAQADGAPLRFIPGEPRVN